MDKIAYDSEGKIYTEPRDADMEKDINDVLLLNGIQKSDGTVRDTSTELLKGRKDTYERAKIPSRRTTAHTQTPEGRDFVYFNFKIYRIDINHSTVFGS